MSTETTGGEAVRLNALLGCVRTLQDFLDSSVTWSLKQNEAQVALNTLHEALGWQPIETAPKTGRIVLLGFCNANGKWRGVRGCWVSQETADEWAEWSDEEVECSAGWYEHADSPEEIGYWPVTPTHWALMPEKPNAALSGGRSPSA